MLNQRSLAQKLGLTQATVSRALRGDPSISKKTQARVQQEAAKLGYTMNPFVSAAMERVRAGRPITEQGCIAIIVDAKSDTDWPLVETYRLQFDGMKRRATLRGYRTECFFLLMEDVNEKSIDHILYSRGISGIILAVPMSPPRKSLELTWERYASVTISAEWNFLPLNRVSSNHWYNVERSFAELARRGYERIGLSLPHSALNPVDRSWLGAYLAKIHHLPRSRQIPIFVGAPETTSLKSFREWYEKWRPEALLCLQGEEWRWIKKMNLSPLKVGLVCLNRPLGSNFSGTEENNTLVGEIACNVVINHLRDNERGLPAHPQNIFVEGTWVEGETLPARNPLKLPVGS
jgi:LacI family transcriptional regulator